MRLAYADPPYPGMSKKHYADHPDYAGEVNHVDLFRTLAGYDGWVLHTGSSMLPAVLLDAATAGVQGFRIMAWVKPWCAFKRNVSPAYSWEPVLVQAARKAEPTGEMIMRDHISEGMTMKKGLAGAKPVRVIEWAFHMVGARSGDTLDDLFPGSGVVGRTWEAWTHRLLADVPPADPEQPTLIEG